MESRRAYPLGIMLALCVAESTVTFETSMIYAAMPTLIRTFGDPFLAGQLVAVHPLIAAATAPIAGRLGDMRGRKSVIIGLICLALVGSIISALSESFPLVLLGRALQGLSVTILSLAVGILRENLAKDRLPMSIGFLSCAQGIGSGSGLILGGVIVDHLNWHWLFVASAGLLLISLIACAIVIPNNTKVAKHVRIDWVEAVLPMFGIASFFLAMGVAKNSGLFSVPALGTFAASLVILYFWSRRSLAAKEPFINLRLFAVRDYAAVNAATLLVGASMVQLIFIFSTYMQSPLWAGVGLGLTATAAGLAKLPSHVLTLTAGPLAAWLALKFGHRHAFVVSCAIALVGWIYALTLPTNFIMIVILLSVASYGVTMVIPAISNIIVDVVPEERTSEAIGTNSVVRGVGQALGGQIVSILLAVHTVAAPTGGGHFPSALSFQLAIGWVVLACTGAVLIGLLLRGGARKTVAGQNSAPV